MDHYAVSYSFYFKPWPITFLIKNVKNIILVMNDIKLKLQEKKELIHLLNGLIQ